MTDLSGVSTEDLQAFKAGDLSKVSTEGLKTLRGSLAPPPEPSEPKLPNVLDDPLGAFTGRVSRGASEIKEGHEEAWRGPGKNPSFMDLALPPGPRKVAKGALDIVSAPVEWATRGVSELASKAIGSVLPEKFTPSPETIESGLSMVGSKNVKVPKVPAVIPSQAELKSSATAGYEAFKDKPITLKPGQVEKLHESIGDYLKGEHFRDYNAPMTFRTIEELKQDPTVANIEATRSVLGNVSGNPRDMFAASLVRERLSEYISNLSADRVETGNVEGVAKTIKEARANYAALKRSELIEDAITAGELRAASTGTGQNVDNTIRQNIRKLVEKIDDKKLRGWTTEERDALERVTRGGNFGNLMRLLGRMAPTGIVSALPSLVTGSKPLEAAQIAAYVPKKLSDYITRRRAMMADELVRSRSPGFRAGSGGGFESASPDLTRAVPPVLGTAAGMDHTELESRR